MLERLGRLSVPTQRWLLVLGCVLLFAVWLARVPITERDETRYAEATREMLASGNFIVPTFNYEWRFQKPILYYWVQAPFVKVLGVNEMAARLPSAVITLVLVLLVHGALLAWLPQGATGDFSRQRARGAAFLGAAVLAIMPLVAVWARSAVTDPTLTLCVSATMLALIQAELSRSADDDRTARRWYYAAAAAVGLAFLTKGPVGLLVPVIAWVTYHLLQGTLGQEARRVPWLGAIALFIIIAIPWYVSTYFVLGQAERGEGFAFLKRFFMTENLERFAGSMEGHGAGNRFLGLFYYLPAAWLFLFPASPFIVRELIQPFAKNTSVAQQPVYARLRRYALCWFGATLVLFSLAGTKLPSYIQPLSAAAAILFAIHLIGRLAPGTSIDQPKGSPLVVRVTEFLLLCIPAVLWSGGVIYLLTRGSADGPFDSFPFPHPLTEIVMGCIAVAGVSLIGMIVTWSIKQRPGRLIAWSMGSWAALLAVLLLGVAPIFLRSQYGPAVALGEALRNEPREYPVYIYKGHSSQRGETLVYYAQRKVLMEQLMLGDAQAVEQMMTMLQEHKIFYLVTNTEGYNTVRSLGKASILKEVNDFKVVKLEPLIATETSP